ncbi:protease inhibitor I42 family protein [Candidatus Bipolaricaulota bacterium]|nr:protease inhibitor I42 family protein [Candidatus Bipolaricaulota bacterium]
MCCRFVMMVCLTLLAALGLVGCSLFTTTVGDEDSGTIQRLDVGDLLVVRLAGNASTGYEWMRVEPSSLEGSPVAIVKETEYQILDCQMLGAPGEFVFRYRAMRPGTVTLGFEHRRPWDPEDPIDTYSVTVWVR